MFKSGVLVATLPCTWRYSVSARTGRPGVSILWQGGIASLILSQRGSEYNCLSSSFPEMHFACYGDGTHARNNNRLAGLVVKVLRLGSGRSEVRISLATGFFRVESYQ